MYPRLCEVPLPAKRGVDGEGGGGATRGGIRSRRIWLCLVGRRWLGVTRRVAV